MSLAFATLACGEAVAQSQDLPNSLSGRWRFAKDGTTQTFSLEEIKMQPDKTFTAKLTWWQYDPWCATRAVPIVGRQTESGITFEVPKKCNISYTVQLRRDDVGMDRHGVQLHAWIRPGARPQGELSNATERRS